MGSVSWVRSVLEPWLTFLRALPAAGLLLPAGDLAGHRRGAEDHAAGAGGVAARRRRHRPRPSSPHPSDCRRRLALLGAPALPGHPRRRRPVRDCRRRSPASGWLSAWPTPRSSPPNSSTGIPGIGGLVKDASNYNNTPVVLVGIFANRASPASIIDGSLRAVERRAVPGEERAR